MSETPANLPVARPDDRPPVPGKRGRLSRPAPRQVFVLLGPALVIYGLFAIWPMLDLLRLSFMRWDGLSPVETFVGFDNYRAILTEDPVFWLAFDNTLIWTALSVVFPPAIGFALALGLNQKLPGRGALRAVFYLPVIIASIAVATMWRWMYDPFFGVINALLTAAGLDGLIGDWLGDRRIALYSIFIAYVWQNVGVSMVLFLAGLQNVSPTLLEAARMDGAKRWGRFVHVVLPAVRPTITVVLILTLINSLKAFDIVYGMTHGGPAQSTQLMAFWAFWQSLQLNDFGRGSAIAVVLLAITIVIVVPYLRGAQGREEAAQ